VCIHSFTTQLEFSKFDWQEVKKCMQSLTTVADPV